MPDPEKMFCICPTEYAWCGRRELVAKHETRLIAGEKRQYLPHVQIVPKRRFLRENVRSISSPAARRCRRLHLNNLNRQYRLTISSNSSSPAKCMDYSALAKNLDPPGEEFECCQGLSECRCVRQHNRIVQSLKQDLGIAARAGMSLLGKMQDLESKEENLRRQAANLSQENARLIAENARLIEENTTTTKAQISVEARAIELETALAAAQARAAHLGTYYALAVSLEEQVSALEVLQAQLETERDAALADTVAYERKWRAATKMAEQVQNAYEVLAEAAAKPSPIKTKPAKRTIRPPLISTTPYFGILPTPDPTPDVSEQETPDTSFESPRLLSDLTPEFEQPFNMAHMHVALTSTPTSSYSPPLRRVRSHDSVLSISAPSIQEPKHVFRQVVHSSAAVGASTEIATARAARPRGDPRSARALLTKQKSGWFFR